MLVYLEHRWTEVKTVAEAVEQGVGAQIYSPKSSLPIPMQTPLPTTSTWYTSRAATIRPGQERRALHQGTWPHLIAGKYLICCITLSVAGRRWKLLYSML